MNIYDAASADLPHNEIKRGDIQPIGQTDDADVALARLREYFGPDAQVTAVEQSEDPGVPGRHAFFPVFN